MPKATGQTERLLPHKGSTATAAQRPEQHQSPGDEQQYAPKGVLHNLNAQSPEYQQNPGNEQHYAPDDARFEMFYRGYLLFLFLRA